MLLIELLIADLTTDLPHLSTNQFLSAEVTASITGIVDRLVTPLSSRQQTLPPPSPLMKVCRAGRWVASQPPPMNVSFVASSSPWASGTVTNKDVESFREHISGLLTIKCFTFGVFTSPLLLVTIICVCNDSKGQEPVHVYYAMLQAPNNVSWLCSERKSKEIISLETNYLTNILSRSDHIIIHYLAFMIRILSSTFNNGFWTDLDFSYFAFLLFILSILFLFWLWASEDS